MISKYPMAQCLCCLCCPYLPKCNGLRYLFSIFASDENLVHSGCRNQTRSEQRPSQWAFLWQTCTKAQSLSRRLRKSFKHGIAMFPEEGIPEVSNSLKPANLSRPCYSTCIFDDFWHASFNEFGLFDSLNTYWLFNLHYIAPVRFRC